MNFEELPEALRVDIMYLLERGYVVELTSDENIAVYLHDYDEVFASSTFNADVLLMWTLDKTESPFAARVLMGLGGKQ